MQSQSAGRRPRVLIVTPEIAHLPQGMGELAGAIRMESSASGDETASLVEELYERRVNIHVALPHYRKLFATDPWSLPGEEFQRYGQLPGSPIHLAEDQIFYNRQGVRLESQDIVRYALAFQREVINRIIFEVRPDLIHCYDWITGLIPAAARKLGIPSLFTVNHHHTELTTLEEIKDRGIDVEGFREQLRMESANHVVDLLMSGVHAADSVRGGDPSWRREMEKSLGEASLSDVRSEATSKVAAGMSAHDYVEHYESMLARSLVSSSSTGKFAAFQAKLDAVGTSESASRSFQHCYTLLVDGADLSIPESTIRPAADIPSLESIRGRFVREGKMAVDSAAVIKLNGGLGTGMGLEQAKSLLKVRGELTFLDLIIRQVQHLRKQHGNGLRFLLMDSFSTSDDTKAFLEAYPEMGSPHQWELMQNRVPKINAETLAPADYPRNPDLEWCPPGHGDLYSALLGSGWLERLLSRGVRYAFISNSDNLGATLNLDLLGYFAQSSLSFLMEVTARTSADRKGGHLAAHAGSGALLLREAAQCPPSDKEAFQDIAKHRFFNTNNLWINLERLKAALDRNGGFLPLPPIRNEKPVDPRDPSSMPVYQLETAMGAAIGFFERTSAVDVPRSRFAPVKQTNDLLGVRSDAYHLTEDDRLELHPSRDGKPPTISLDPAYYKYVDQLDEGFPNGAPSLIECRSLAVEGPVRFAAGVVIKGDVTIRNTSSEWQELASGVYEDREIDL